MGRVYNYNNNNSVLRTSQAPTRFSRRRVQRNPPRCAPSSNLSSAESVLLRIAHWLLGNTGQGVDHCLIRQCGSLDLK